MTVGLRPITPPEYERWRPGADTSYVEQIVASGRMDAERAAEKARQDHERLLPDGLHSEDMLFFTAVENGRPVGILWLATRAPAGAPGAWVCDVEVDVEHRGRGLGRQIMLAGEAECRRRGIGEIGLNVWGSNASAIALYDSLGYKVMAQQMRKTLDDEAGR